MFSLEIYNQENLVINHNDEEAWNIAYATDGSYAKFMGISIFSILKNNPNRNINFHLFVTEVDTQDIEKIKLFRGLNCNIILYRLNPLFFENLPVCGHFSTAIYYRIAIPKILCDVDKCLYLDTDILCVGDLSRIFEQNLEDVVIAACRDNLMPDYHLEYLSQHGFHLSDDYFNSGVILFNNQNWIKNDIFNKFISKINSGDFPYPDQDVLNILLQGKVLFLPQKYNWIEWNVDVATLASMEKIQELSLIHFVGDIKPWHNAASIDIYDQYIQASPWQGMEYLPPNNTRNYRRFAKRLWKKGQRKLALKYQIIYFLRKLKGIK